MTDRFLIAPFNSGLDTSLRPWMIPDDAFAQLTNAYVFRGRIRKRFGAYLMGTGAPSLLTAPLFSRFRVNIGTTNGVGSLAGTVPGDIYKEGQLFSVGTVIFTVYNSVAGPQQMYRTDGLLVAATYDITTGNYNITGAPINTSVYFYPAQPVMGLTNYEVGPVNDQPSYGFDTQFAYTFTAGSWQRSITGITPTWHGNNADFYWSTNWYGLEEFVIVLFTTNFNVNIGLGLVTDDPIWAFSTSFATPGWQPFSYSPAATINTTNQQPYTVTQTTTTTNPGDTITNFVQSARIIVPFKDRLLLLNTIENNANGAVPFDPGDPTHTGITPASYLTSTNTEFVNRCRFSHFGSPFSDSAWLEPGYQYTNGTNPTVNADGGDFIDATTDEAIVTAEFIKDRLIVYFERSTWEIVYLGNQVTPFTWQKINTELGADGTFSVVPFDKVVLGIGNTGVHACTGANVERIDNKIPDQVFEILNRNEGTERVVGIRDYYTELVYWTFPSTQEDQIEVYPNQVLVYNYKTGSWAINEDCITMFGYFEQQFDTTWATIQGSWEQNTQMWNSGVQIANFRQVIAGNQQGFVFIVSADNPANAQVMSITNVTPGFIATTITAIDHTLAENQYVLIENAQGVLGLNGVIYQVLSIVDSNNFTIFANFTGLYAGGGTLRRVSNIQMLSKQWNPYISQGRNVYLAKIDFCVLRTGAGEVTVDYYPSGSQYSMIISGTETEMIMGNNILETSPYALVPFEQVQDRLWHQVYFQTQGEFIQIYIFMNPAQITQIPIAFSDFQLEAMILHTQPTSERLQ